MSRFPTTQRNSASAHDDTNVKYTNTNKRSRENSDTALKTNSDSDPKEKNVCTHEGPKEMNWQMEMINEAQYSSPEQAH